MKNKVASTINTVLFDLGQTLVHYYNCSEIPVVLRQIITSTQNFLLEKGLLTISPEIMWERVKEENYEAQDYRVRPLEERLVRIFQLNEKSASQDLIMEMCRAFMKPIFVRAYCYKDTHPALKNLKLMGFKTAVISNTPWGSPAELWREEIERHGLSEYMDALVFCRDVGWRKPARQIFEFALERLDTLPHNCIFVGDDTRWDLAGPRAVGIDAILINRSGKTEGNEQTIKSLMELCDKLPL